MDVRRSWLHTQYSRELQPQGELITYCMCNYLDVGSHSEASPEVDQNDAKASFFFLVLNIDNLLILLSVGVSKFSSQLAGQQ